MTQIRLNKALSRAGFASLRGADELIRQGRVEVNGRAMTEMGVMVDVKKDRIFVDGEPLHVPKKKHYFLFFKPGRVVSTMTDPEGRSCISDYTTQFQIRLFPAGRLDFDADGLMLLTNDGEMANDVTHPSSHLPKTYQVKTTGHLDVKELSRFRGGIPIDGKKTLPAVIVPLKIRQKNAWYEVTIMEGRNRQIKKMFGYFRKRVLKIRRISIGPLSLEGMAPGEIKRLTQGELSSLKDALNMGKEG